MTDSASVVGAPPRAAEGRTRPLNRAWLALLLLSALALPFLAGSYALFMATQLMIFAIAVIGLNLVVVNGGQISLGHGAFFAAGAYIMALLLNQTPLPHVLVVVIAGLLCFGAGWLFAKPALRLSGPYLALATFALAVTTPQFLKLEALRQYTGGSQGLSVTTPFFANRAGITFEQWLYWLSLLVVVLAFVLARNITVGRTGRAIAAVREHPIAASAMGVPIARYSTALFAVSAALAGVAGSLAALLTQFVSPDSFSVLLSMSFIVACITGGSVGIAGPMLGAAFIVLAPNVVEKINPSAPGALYGVLLILCAIFLPQGASGSLRLGFARIRQHLLRARSNNDEFT